MRTLPGSNWALGASSTLLIFACAGDRQGTDDDGGSSGSPTTATGGTTASGASGSTSTSTGGTSPATSGSAGAAGTSGASVSGSGGAATTGGAPNTGGKGDTGGASNTGGGDTGGASNTGGGNTGGAPNAGSGGSSGTTPIDPSAPLTPVAFFPSKGRSDACADASISIQFNRTPVIVSGGAIQIHEASGDVFDSVTSSLQSDLYYSDLVQRSAGGQNFSTDALDVVFNTVVFQPKGKLDLGKTYYVTVDEGMITDSMGTAFSVQQSDNWSFTVRAQEPGSADAHTLAADGSGDYCSLSGVLAALPDSAQTPRIVTVKAGVYPGIVRMSDSNVHFQGEGLDQAIFSHKNSAKMNSSREGIVVTGSDITFENLTIFNTYLQDSNGQQAEALYVSTSSQRVFLNNVHLRSHQDTLRVDGPSVYMKGGKISGSTDPLWGYGGFYCDGCELSSRTSGHSFVVARSTKGFAMVNCSVTRDAESVNNTYLAQYHDGNEAGKIAFANCEIDDHIVGWRRPENNDWYEYENTDLAGNPVMFDGTQLTAGSSELDSLSSAENWLGWAP